MVYFSRQGGRIMLTFNKINKYFGEFHVLQDIDFTVESGKIFGYLGRNGAGKTTSLRILMDVFKPTTGSITINGKPFNRHDYKIGYLPEERGMYAKTKVKDQLIYFAMLRGATKQDAIRSVTYWADKFEVDIYLNEKLETLSKGNQQKIQITQAFLNEPDILILDEPFSGLDPVNAQIFQDALLEYKKENRFIIFSSHQMSYVESFCDDIAIIDGGKIILSGNLNEIKESRSQNRYMIKSNDPNIEAYLGDFEKKREFYIVNHGDNPMHMIYKLLEKGIMVEAFSKYQPSLHEIFVNEVGVQSEES